VDVYLDNFLIDLKTHYELEKTKREAEQMLDAAKKTLRDHFGVLV